MRRGVVLETRYFYFTTLNFSDTGWENPMKFFKKHCALILFVASILCMAAGFMLQEHKMMFSYAVVVCLSCMGIG